MRINNVEFTPVAPAPCLRLVQYGKGLPITCRCPHCATRGQTQAEAFASVAAANA